MDYNHNEVAELLRHAAENIEEIMRQTPEEVAEIKREADEKQAAGLIEEAAQLRKEAQRVCNWVETLRRLVERQRSGG